MMPASHGAQEPLDSTRQRAQEPGTPHAFFSVKTQFENVGDALITRELVRLVATDAKTFVDLSRCPPSFRETLRLNEIPNVQCYERAGFVRLAVRLCASRLGRRRAFYFLSPGGRGSELSLTAYLRGRIFNGLLLTLKGLGVRVCHVGVSYDNLGSRHAKLLKGRVAMLAFHGVRDRITARHLRSLGIRVDDVLPDLALARFPGPAPRAASDPPVLALSFRRDKYPEGVDSLLRTVFALIDSLPRGARVKIVSQVTRDDAFAREIHKALRGRSHIQVDMFLCSSDIDECVQTYSDCDRIYSNRLHALLIAASAGATPVALVHPQADVKIVGVFEDLNLGRHVVAIPCLDMSRLSSPPLDQEHLGRVAERLREAMRTLLVGSVLE